eukprot:15480874-Alexandrium_andersonii.AAC.1
MYEPWGGGGSPTLADSEPRKRAVWPVGHAGTADPSGSTSGPELTLISTRGPHLRLKTVNTRFPWKLVFSSASAAAAR